MKQLKLSKNQVKWLNEFLYWGIPDNMNDRLGTNQANIIKRHIKKITSNPVWELINKALHNLEWKYDDMDLNELLALLQSKSTEDLNPLNALYLAYEYGKENNTKAFRHKWFIEWLHQKGIYCTYQLRNKMMGMAIDFPEYISVAYNADLDNIDIHK